MLKFMKKIPGGLLLVPMFISALVATFAPGLFRIGGMTEAFLTPKGTNFIVALICFCSSTLLDLSTLKHVLRKQGSMLLLKIALCFGLSFLFSNLFGPVGVLGISSLAFAVAITSLNPSIYLALISDYGTEEDRGAFALTGILLTPAFPMLVFSIASASNFDWISLLSALIPTVLGILIGNLDRDMAKLLSPMIVPLTPIMGWIFGSSINLIAAVQSGISGILLTVLYYLAMFPIIYLFERYVLKEDGISTFGITSIAGASVPFPLILAELFPEVAAYAPTATAQIAMGVIITSILTPFVAAKFAQRHQIAKNQPLD